MNLFGKFAASAAILSISIGAAAGESAVQNFVDAPPAWDGFGEWRTEPPADCPFPRSETFRGVSFTSRHAEYTNADTWYPSWAADGKMYSPWTDGKVGKTRCFSIGRNAATGHATIIGDDPMNLQIVDEGVFKSDPGPYNGRYPCGSLVYNGVWYYGTYCLSPDPFVRKNGQIYNWPCLGPFVGFRWSTDFGKTWNQTPCTPAKPLFGENGLKGAPVKIGVPCFIDFGRNMEHSPDGKAYLVVQGSSDGRNRRYGYNSWITADQVFLIRVEPSIENMNDASKYEFFAGRDGDGKPVWTRDFAKIAPLLEWRDRMGRVSATYNPALRKYLMCVTDGDTTVSKYHTYILEADEPAGPWKLAAYLKDFGEQAYFVNIPSKFIDGKDGRTMWLCYSANFSCSSGNTMSPFYRSVPSGSGYRMCLQEFRLVEKDEEAGEKTTADLNEFLSAANLARTAKVRASSTRGGYTAEAAVDGVVAGWPDDEAAEWASNSERESAFIRLDWDKPQKVGRVRLFDRPNDIDRILSGRLVFSDGTSILAAALPDGGGKGLEISFPQKTVRWIMFAVDEVKSSTQNAGLAEIAVFE